ncbi:MAG: DNA (cytosine-5-)-methyltransferase [Anaerolineae bacterium]|nr:DNA (cytosine-5-)-methyltransferase [Anaerolineae bacterium]MDQ7035167.1 DNA (cytosine-5-)-methyltransferase [Anaerolineae bacterium]
MTSKTILRTVSLFSGCGGSDLGAQGDFLFLDKYYSRLNTGIVFANDINKKAASTYSLNFEHEIDTRSIQDISADEIPNHELLIAGFPCQPFSVVGLRQGFEDIRGQLFQDITRILQYHQPKAFIAENVKGLVNMDDGNVLEYIIDEFSNTGYKVNYRVVNSADFGVPQKRQRIFIVGIHDSLGFEYKFPYPTHTEFPSFLTEQEWIPLGAILDSLESVDSKYYFSERAVAGMKRANKAFNKGRYQDLEKPCNTITTHLAKVSLNGTDPVLLVDENTELYRRFTPREAARIQSFPDDFKFVGSDGDAYRQIGNAIPPVVMWHIVKALIEQTSTNGVA